MDLPKITQEPILHVDATPDEEYPLRILKAYREICDCEFSESTNRGGQIISPLIKAMNEHNEKRAEILDRAIAKLRITSTGDVAKATKE